MISWWWMMWWSIRLTIMFASIRTIGQTSIINLERHLFDGVASPSSSTHPCEKALQFVVVSDHRRKVVVVLIPIDGEQGRRMMLARSRSPTNLEGTFW